MTVQKTLKLTALGLGMASIALTGCKGKDGGNGVDGKNGTIIPSTNNDTKITTPDGKEVPHFIIGFDGTVKDKDGNVYQAKYKVGRNTQPEIRILGPGLPSNSCVPFEVVVKDLNSKEIVLNNAAAFYDEDGNSINKKIHYKLDGESQKIAIIKGSTICVLKKEELNKLHSVHNNNKDNADNADFRDINTFKAAIVGDKIKLVVEGVFDKTTEAEIKIIDPEINIVGIEGNKHYIPIPAGTQSGAFRIFGKKATRDYTTHEQRTGVSFNSATTIDKNSVESIALYDKHSGKEIPEALVADQKNHTWRIDSSKIPHDYIKDPSLLTFIEHEIRLKLIDGTTTLRIPVYIKIEKAIPVEYRVTQLNTNVFGKQSFHVELRYSNSKEFVNIADLPASERKYLKLKFDIKKNLEANIDSSVKISSTLNSVVNAVYNGTSISNYEDLDAEALAKLSKLDKSERAFWINTQNAPAYQETTNKYHLIIQPEYTRNLNENQLTKEEIENLPANKRLNYTCGTKSLAPFLTEQDYNKNKDKITNYQLALTQYNEAKNGFEKDKAKIGNSADYTAYLTSKNAITDVEFNRIKALTAPAVVTLAADGSNQAAFDQYTRENNEYNQEKSKIGNSADYTAYLTSKTAINSAEFIRIKALTAPTLDNLNKPENFEADKALYGANYNEYKANFEAQRDSLNKAYNESCTVKFDGNNNIVAIDKTIKGANANGQIIRHFVISPFKLVLETKPYFYSIDEKDYTLPKLTKNTNDSWTPDLFVGADSKNANERYKYGCVKLVSEFKVFRHKEVKGKLEKELVDGKHETLLVNNFVLSEHTNLKTDTNRIDPKIVNINGKTSTTLRQNNIYCPSETEALGAKKLVAEFQDLKSNEVALNVIDVRMPILTMLFENGQNKHTFANNSEVSILPFYKWSSGKFEKAQLNYAKIQGKFTYTHADEGNTASYYFLVDNNSASTQQTDTFRKLMLNRADMASSNLNQKASVDVAVASSAALNFDLTNDAATFNHIIKYESYFNSVPNQTKIDLVGSKLEAFSVDQGVSEHYHNYDTIQTLGQNN
ncbi:hypothetical protein [Pigmentibacter ruber]|uniref:hypothetical protein n=1 Tax=Pigmentibacter ruber TaxID=2683196 RepID=UPI00131D95B5|nr:hypothetical protein [Pigmentibacter ruber]